MLSKESNKFKYPTDEFKNKLVDEVKGTAKQEGKDVIIKVGKVSIKKIPEIVEKLIPADHVKERVELIKMGFKHNLVKWVITAGTSFGFWLISQLTI